MIAIDLKGIDGVMASINKTIQQAEEGTKKAMATFVKAVETDAKRNAPANEGILRNSIDGSVLNFLGSKQSTILGKITVRCNYAAYLEFGTRKFAAKYVATLPQDWKAYAATFKGKGGGTFAEFIDDLIQWIKAKGIDVVNHHREQQYDPESGNTIVQRKRRVSKDKKQQMTESAAYAIALHILREGIRPQPFLYPAVVKHTPKLIESIKKVFE